MMVSIPVPDVGKVSTVPDLADGAGRKRVGVSKVRVPSARYGTICAALREGGGQLSIWVAGHYPIVRPLYPSALWV